MSELDITVAITGMNARPDNPGPGLAVARCLREAAGFRGRIIGLGYDALDPGLYLPQYCDAAYLLPYPSAGDQALLDQLQLIQQQENIDVLLPCLDAELPGLVRLLPALQQMGLKTFLPEAQQLRLRNKDRLPELADMAGIACPEITPVTQAGFFYDCQEKGWSYPLVVKGIFYGAHVAHTAEEGADAFRKIAAEWGYPVLVQQYVKGEEYNLTAVGDGRGNLLGPVMMKKMAITDKGKAWAGISIDEPALLEASESLARAIRWRGPLEVEVMRDHQGHYQLIEINPRFPAWIYLSVGVERNLPYTLLQLAVGETPDAFASVKSGRLFLRYALETIIAIEDFETMVMRGGQSLSPPLTNKDAAG